ncbi:hypothetical protein HMI56_006180, partial [Coelomomyces lativittatus]
TSPTPLPPSIPPTQTSNTHSNKKFVADDLDPQVSLTSLPITPFLIESSASCSPTDEFSFKDISDLLFLHEFTARHGKYFLYLPPKQWQSEIATVEFLERIMFSDELFAIHGYALARYLMYSFIPEVDLTERQHHSWQAIYHQLAQESHIEVIKKDAISMNPRERLTLLCDMVNLVSCSDVYRIYSKTYIETPLDLVKKNAPEEIGQRHAVSTTEIQQRMRTLEKEIEKVDLDIESLTMDKPIHTFLKTVLETKRRYVDEKLEKLQTLLIFQQERELIDVSAEEETFSNEELHEKLRGGTTTVLSVERFTRQSKKLDGIIYLGMDRHFRRYIFYRAIGGVLIHSPDDRILLCNDLRSLMNHLNLHGEREKKLFSHLSASINAIEDENFRFQLFSMRQRPSLKCHDDIADEYFKPQLQSLFLQLSTVINEFISLVNSRTEKVDTPRRIPEEFYLSCQKLSEWIDCTLNYFVALLLDHSDTHENYRLPWRSEKYTYTSLGHYFLNSSHNREKLLSLQTYSELFLWCEKFKEILEYHHDIEVRWAVASAKMVQTREWKKMMTEEEEELKSMVSETPLMLPVDGEVFGSQGKMSRRSLRKRMSSRDSPIPRSSEESRHSLRPMRKVKYSV